MIGKIRKQVILQNQHRLISHTAKSVTDLRNKHYQKIIIIKKCNSWHEIA